MNSSYLRFGLLVCTLIFPAAFVHAGDESQTPDIPKARPSHQSIQDKITQQQKDASRQERSSAKPVQKPVDQKKKFNIADEDTLLVSKGLWTPLPKGTVIYTPNHLKSKIAGQPKGKISDWKQFLQKNKGWIHLHPVTMAQARGSQIKPEVIKAYQSMGKMVIATYQNNPISVMPAALVIPKE